MTGLADGTHPGKPNPDDTPCEEPCTVPGCDEVNLRAKCVWDWYTPHANHWCATCAGHHRPVRPCPRPCLSAGARLALVCAAILATVLLVGLLLPCPRSYAAGLIAALAAVLCVQIFGPKRG